MSDMSKIKVGANTYDIKDKKSRGVPLTWAQYQALSYEEQHNGTAYYITDMDAVYPVDHELNANSGNAVANDVVTPHIIAMENVLGAKNVDNALLAENSGTSATNTGTGYRVQSTTAAAYSWYLRWYKLPKNTDFIVSSNITIAAGTGGFSIHGNSTMSKTGTTRITESSFNTSGKGELTFNTGNYEYIAIFIFATWSSAVIGDVTYDEFMIRQVDTDPTWVPPAMTNEQLTERVDRGSVTFSFTTSMTLGQAVETIYNGIDKSKVSIKSVLDFGGGIFRSRYFARSGNNIDCRMTSINVASADEIVLAPNELKFLNTVWLNNTIAVDKSSENLWANLTAIFYY